MTTVSQLIVHRIRIPLVRQFVTARRSANEQDAVLAERVSVAAALPGATLAHDLDAALWMCDSPVSGGIPSLADTVRLSDAPGLGIVGLMSLGDIEP